MGVHVTSESKINTQDIVNEFVENVKNVVLDGAHHIGWIPDFQDRYICVPPEVLGNLNEVFNPTPGYYNMKANSASLYRSLIEVTTILLRTGTYVYTRMRRTDHGYDNVQSISGKAFFTASYTAEQLNGSGLQGVDRSDVWDGRVLTASGLNSLIINCLKSWENSTKPRYTKTDIYCHSSCHSSCHGDCHHDNYDINCHCDGVCYSNGTHLVCSGHCNCFS